MPPFSLNWIMSGYFQVRVDEEKMEKTAFPPIMAIMNGSMPFDLINASSTFKWWTRYWHHYQQIRASLFWLYHQLLLFIKTRALLSSKRSPPTVSENHLISKKKKWFFHFKSLEFSGHIIDKDGIQIDRAEISKIRDWSTSTTIK